MKAKYINRRILDKTFRYLIRTFKGWDIEIDVDRKDYTTDVKSIRIDIIYPPEGPKE